MSIWELKDSTTNYHKQFNNNQSDNPLILRSTFPKPVINQYK
ncbi:13110_t:CDS:1, partial [Gigaspora margarita]